MRLLVDRDEPKKKHKEIVSYRVFNCGMPTFLLIPKTIYKQEVVSSTKNTCKCV